MPTSYNSNRGSILSSIMVALGIIGISVFFMDTMSSRQKVTKIKIDAANYPIQSSSAAELALLVIRRAEYMYYKKVNENYGANPVCFGNSSSFFIAILRGVECPGANPNKIPIPPLATFPSFKIFSASDWGAPLSVPSFIKYNSENCEIKSSMTEACGDKNKKFSFSIGDNNSADMKDILGGVHTFTFDSVDTVNGMIVMRVTNGLNSYRVGFRWEPNNLAHIEPNGTVSQENPDLNSMCPHDIRKSGTVNLGPWGPLVLYDDATAKCRGFTQLGSGRGLAYYLGNYFGVRQTDGQITVFNKMWDESSPYIVSENGKLRTKGSSTDQDPVGFEYSKSALVNVDDITIVDGGHIYTISGQGTSAKISFLKKGTCPTGLGGTDFSGWCRIPVCKLGISPLNYGLKYKGISAPAWTTSLFNSAGNPDNTLPRSANFKIKGSSGNMYNVFVYSNKAQTTSPTYLSCTVTMNREEQQVEYKRTFGFDRVDVERPYSIF